jgi:hypothetical protein
MEMHADRQKPAAWIISKEIETQRHAITRVVSGPRAGFQNLARYSVFKERRKRALFPGGKSGRGT